MTIEHSHGRARPTLPRSRDVMHQDTGQRAEPTRDAQGRVVGSDAARELAQGRGWKAQIAKMAGRDLSGEAADLGRAAFRLYRQLLRDLPFDAPSVRTLVASQARSAIVAARCAELAIAAGLHTPAGERLMTLSAKLDQRAERVGVTALDTAARLAAIDRKRKPIDAHARVLEAFGEPTTNGGSDV